MVNTHTHTLVQVMDVSNLMTVTCMRHHLLTVVFTKTRLKIISRQMYVFRKTLPHLVFFCKFLENLIDVNVNFRYG